jgi:HEAT repeat protein
MKLLAASSFLACVSALLWPAAVPGLEPDEEPAYMGRSLRLWILELKDEDPQVRYQAGYVLSRMGPRIRPAFAALKIAAKDTDVNVRQFATEALGYTGPQALPVLLELLESENNRYAAVTGLQRLEPDPLPEMLKLLKQGEPRRRRAVAATLRIWWQRSGDYMPAMRVALKDPDALVRIEAMEATRGTRPNRAIPLEFVQEMLKDKDPDVRFRAGGMLRDMDWLPEAAHPVLEKLLRDSDKRVRVNAAWAMLELDLQRPAPMQVILDGLRDKNEAVRRHAAFVFDQIFYRHSDAVRAALPDLIEFVRDYKQHPAEVVDKALWAFASLEPDPKVVVPLLKAMLQDANPAIRGQAAHTLAHSFRSDPTVKSMLPDSIKRVPSRVRSDATAVLLTLKKRPENVVSGLVELLQGTDQPALRWQALRILAEMGTEAKEAIPALRGALEDKNPTFRESALLAICRIEPDRIAELTPAAIRLSNWQSSSPHDVIQTLQTRAGEVTPVLVQGLRDPDPQYRLRAGFLLMNLGPAARSAVPELRVALENKEPVVRILAAITLARINPQTEGIVPVLRSGLAFNDYAVRQEVLHSIGSMGPAARDLMPDLVRILKNKAEGQFRGLAANVLQNRNMPPVAEEMESVFAGLIKDSDPQVRATALLGLGQMNLKDKALLTTLVGMLHADPNGYQHHDLIGIIYRFGPAASEEVSKRLNDTDPQTRATFLSLYLRLGGANQDELNAVLDRAMKDEAPTVRLTAAGHLLGMERDSNKAFSQVLPIIKQCLESSDSQVRQQAIGFLQGLAQPHRDRARGKPPQEIIALLVEQAQAKDAKTRVIAINALASIYPPPVEGETAILQAFKDKDSEVRQAAVFGFHYRTGRVKEAVPALIELLKEKGNFPKLLVINNLSQAGHNDPAAVAAIIEYYRKLRPSSLERAGVLSALGTCDDKAKDAIPLCVEALNDEDDNLRESAVRALMRIDPTNKQLVSALVDVNGRKRDPYWRPGRFDKTRKPLGPQAAKELRDILANDKDADRRAGAAIVLGTMVQDAKDAEKALKNAMKDANPRVRLLAADAYWLAMNDTKTPMPVMLAALKDKDVSLRQWAAQDIAEMGKEATHAAPHLVEFLKDQDEAVAGWLVHALSQMGKEAARAIPALVDIVRDGGDSWARSRAADALMPFGREAKDAVPGLLDMLKSGRHNRGAAARALAKIATPAEALPALLEVFAAPPRDEFDQHDHAVAEALHEFGPAAIGPAAELLQHKRGEVRIRAINVLVRFGKQAQSIVPQLMDVMDDKDEDVSLRAAEAVWIIDRRPEVLPHFLRGLKAKTANNRIRAAQNLMNMGPEAKPAVPELVAACKDRDSSVRREAYRALTVVDNETARKLGAPDVDGK